MRGNPSGQKRLGGRKLGIDALFELVDGLGARDGHAVDQKVGRTSDIQPACERHVLVDLALATTGRQGTAKFRRPKPRLASPGHEGVGTQVALVREGKVVELPKRRAAAERERCHGRLRGWTGVLVKR